MSSPLALPVLGFPCTEYVVLPAVALSMLSGCEERTVPTALRGHTVIFSSMHRGHCTPLVLCVLQPPTFFSAQSKFVWLLIFDSDASSATPQLKPPGGLTRPSSISLFLAQCRWCFCFHSVIFLFLIRILFLCLKKVSVSTQWSGVQSPWPFSCSSRDQPAFCRLSSTLQYPCRNRCTLAPN